MYKKNKYKKGFTLLECIIAACCIAILIFILLQPLGHTSCRGYRHVKCLSHLRGLGAGFAIYASENEGAIPQSIFTNNILSDECMKTTWLDLMIEYQGDPKVRFCPKGPDNNKCGFTPNKEIQICYGSTTQKWFFDVGCNPNTEIPFYQGSYGMNDWTSHGPIDESNTENKSLDHYWKTMDVGPADKIPLIMDSITIGSSPGTEDVLTKKHLTQNEWKSIIPPSQEHVDTLDENDWTTTPPSPGPWKSEDDISHIFLDRHPNKSINMVFLDGHGSKVQLVDLFEQKWHRKYQKHYRDEISNLSNDKYDYQWFVPSK